MDYNFPKVILKNGKERSLLRLHPWVFSGAIKNIIGNPLDGDNVVVLGAKGEFYGLGHYQKGGSISVRIYSFDSIQPDEKFWKQKFAAAVELRRSIGLLDNSQTNVFRLIHGEGDGMPGFICDFYNGTVVFQAHSYGMYLLEPIFAKIILELLGDKVVSVYDKSANTLPKTNNGVENKFLYGSCAETLVKEYGMKFFVNVEEGQKTGFFIDQRENRNLLRHYAKGKNVLNMFGYTGGFSVAALAGEANSVVSVDASQTAISLTERNVNQNFSNTSNHQAMAVDAFEYLDKMEKNKYNLIILDPPAFAKHASAMSQAVKGYQRINRAAMEKIAAGSILFTFSCSQAIDKNMFRLAVMDASIQAGRKIKILHQLTQPADHPISIYHPEGEYLKGLVVYVE